MHKRLALEEEDEEHALKLLQKAEAAFRRVHSMMPEFAEALFQVDIQHPLTLGTEFIRSVIFVNWEIALQKLLSGLKFCTDSFQKIQEF